MVYFGAGKVSLLRRYDPRLRANGAHMTGQIYSGQPWPHPPVIKVRPAQQQTPGLSVPKTQWHLAAWGSGQGQGSRATMLSLPTARRAPGWASSLWPEIDPLFVLFNTT